MKLEKHGPLLLFLHQRRAINGVSYLERKSRGNTVPFFCSYTNGRRNFKNTPNSGANKPIDISNESVLFSRRPEPDNNFSSETKTVRKVCEKTDDVTIDFEKHKSVLTTIGSRNTNSFLQHWPSKWQNWDRRKVANIWITRMKNKKNTAVAGAIHQWISPMNHLSRHRSWDSPYSPFTNCWTTFTGSVGKSLLPWRYLVGPYTSVPRWCRWCIK